jgi:hypothetical protein
MSLDPKPARRLLDEPAAWREMGQRGERLMYAALDGLDPSVQESALRRLRSYDDIAWNYGEGDHFASMTAEDAEIAAEWLALDAESDEALP